MTDEEKAEKYLIRFLQKNNIMDILPIKTAWDLRCLLIDVIKYVFVEDKPKWHDLRKDPNDLPTKTLHYFTNAGECVYDAFHRKWRTIACDTCWDCHWLDNVIAWTELPKFEEE